VTDLLAGRLLVAESDPTLRRLLAFRLRREGFDVSELAEPWNVKDKLSVEDPDLVLLELAGVDQFDLLADLCHLTDAAVIAMLVVRSHDDQAVALDLGADDCVARPVCLRTVVARSRAVLRRRVSTPPRHLRYDPLHIDLSARTVRLRGQVVELTAREFDLLAFLASHPTEVFTREQLLRSVWSSSAEWQQADTVTEHIHRLRCRLEDDRCRPRWLLTVRGVGYRFCP
jgi:DNA-binding response OmpR family regulator